MKMSLPIMSQGRCYFISQCRMPRAPNHRSESSSDEEDDDDADDERDESLLEPLASRRLELCDRLLLRDRLPLLLLSPFEAADEEDEDEDFCFFFFLRSFFSRSRSSSRSRFSRRLRFRSFLSCSSLSKAAMGA